MGDHDLWVFGYGSLIWRPGFSFAERCVGRLSGYSRRFCMSSVHYRGTPERPGLVLALAPGGECRGVAYRVEAADAAAVLAYLRERELVSYAYKEMRLPVVLDRGETIEAVAYVTDPEHPQFCGHYSLEEQAAIIATAAGPMGPNSDYLLRTEASLAALGLEDPEVAALAALVRARLEQSLS